MNISQVIAWKFNGQPGMFCREVGGTMTIIRFPGGVPSQSLQDQWTTEYNAYITAGSDKDDEATVKMNTPTNQALVDAFLELTNQIRALNSQSPVARSVVVAWLKGKYRAHL